MPYKFAIQFDGGFVTKIMKPILRREIQVSDLENVLSLVKTSDKLVGFNLLRAYYYDSPPFKGTKKNPATGTVEDFGVTPQYKRQCALHDAIKFQKNFALRCGDLKFRGWKLAKNGVDTIPNFQQKGVDIKIALDIAQMAYKHTVDAIVLFSGDMDITPALKMARREGVWVYYVNVTNAKNMYIGNEIKVHSDNVIDITI